MTSFVESCVETVADSAGAVARTARKHLKAKKLLKLLADKKNILVTTHHHPDPDALASSHALCELLRFKLRDARVSMTIKGEIVGGMNETFARLSNLDLIPWNEAGLSKFDAIILLDTQPQTSYNPLPSNIVPLAVIDHHRLRGRRFKCPFGDIRTDVGATSSIVFGYFMELEVPISPDLGAMLLYAIESDLAGAAGTPNDLDNVALSSLTLVADTHKLYQMRYVDLPQSYFVAYAAGLNNANYFDNAIVSHIGEIDSTEKPAILADFLLRFDQVKWSLVTSVYGTKMIMSCRTSDDKASAADMIRKLLRNIGEGGGHRTKAGGYIPLENGTPTEIDRWRKVLKRRFLRSLKIKSSRGQRLVPPT